MAFDPAAVTAIDARLAVIGHDERVRIPLAIESGSRAWGFPSPDSDYDCRFLFVRARDAYLDLWPPRDVIETPLDPVLDVNGWDVGKAIRLILAGNAVAIEWLTSPIAYRRDEGFAATLLAFAGRHAGRASIQRHYHQLAQRQRALWSERGQGKKLFYMLRPALSLRWLRQRPEARIAPMHLAGLIDETGLDGVEREAIAALVASKRRAREADAITAPESVLALVDRELEQPLAAGEPPLAGAREEAVALFRGLVERFAP